MGFIEVNNVVFCGVPDCEAVYMWDGKTEGGDIRAKTVLPCGHEIAEAFLDGGYIRDNYKGIKMLDYLDRNGMLKAGAYEAIREKGGRFDDALNIDVPAEDLTADERRKLAEMETRDVPGNSGKMRGRGNKWTLNLAQRAAVIPK